MAWTVGTDELAGGAARASSRPRGLLGWLLVAVVAALCVLWFLGHTWAAYAAFMVAGAQSLASGLKGLASARPPEGGPLFAIERIREGPVEVVGRVVPPKQALLSPLTSTKCSYFAYVIRVLDEATGETRVVEERRKLCDFWLKDVTGSIWVQSEGIDIRLPKQLDEDLRTYDQTPRAVGEHLHKLGVDPFLAPGVRRAIFLEETRLDPGDNVLVKGHAVRDAEGRLVIAKPPGGTLSVERWSKPTFVARAPAGTRVRTVAGAVMLLVGLAGLARLLLG